MQSHQRYSFKQNRFDGLWSSQRPSASLWVNWKNVRFFKELKKFESVTLLFVWFMLITRRTGIFETLHYFLPQLGILLSRFFEKIFILQGYWYFDQKFTFWIYQSNIRMNIENRCYEKNRKKKSLCKNKFRRLIF